MKSSAPTPEQRVAGTERNVQQEMWQLIGAIVNKGLKKFLEDMMESEVTEQIKAKKYERSRARGWPLLEIPGYPLRFGRRPAGSRLADWPADLHLFDKYQRRHDDVGAAIGRLFLAGVSTRRLRWLAKELFGQEVSATTVSRTTAYPDDELKQYQSKTLNDEFPFLFLDGIHQKVREIGVENKVMLCAMGMKADGSREMPSFDLAEMEDTDCWRGLLADLKSRGLQGKQIKLTTTDGNPSLL